MITRAIQTIPACVFHLDPIGLYLPQFQLALTDHMLMHPYPKKFHCG